MSDEIKLSVIVLTYNCENYISQTLDSILSQDCNFKFEIVIVDDCSTDNTPQVLNGIASREDKIQLYFNESNVGIFANFHKAIQYCSSEIIAYCGHDDFWHNKNKLQKQYDFLAEKPNFGLVYSDFNLLNEATGELKQNVNKLKKRTPQQEVSYKDLIDNYSISSCTPCFRKEVYLKYVPVSDFIDLKFPVEDWPTYITISIHSRVGYIDESMATFRVGHESASNSNNIAGKEEYMNGHERMFNYLKNKYPNEFSEYSDTYYPIYKNTVLLRYAYKINNYKLAKKHAIILSKYNCSPPQVTFAKNRFLFRAFRLFHSLVTKIPA